ncbi:unnamed protein product [Diatraea saccharalis]|uniref:Uncharacterized protein n=1 Tax=Diatraea saccharalis TaxID=40085 RepID=A0A9N9WCI4_9NEOP|nr:unnamed protein product [Diatraea saccharalis]
MMYKKYTFSYRNGKRQLVCSSELSKKCKAKLTMDKTGLVVLRANVEHNHPPPVYHKTLDESLQAMKNKFYERVTRLKSLKGKPSQLYTKIEYLQLINLVRISRTKTKNKTPIDYHRCCNFDILREGDTDKLIVPLKDKVGPVRYFTYLEEMFDIIHDTHMSTKHGGRDKMRKLLQPQFKNITREIIMQYLNVCVVCRKKGNKKDTDE